MIPHSLISIVVPVYNTEIYLKRCIKSLLRQSYKNLEIIVVDDHSSGNCAEIIADFKKIDTRIQYVRHEKNRGLFQARLTGARMAQGDFIAFVDSDDHVSFDYYRLLLAAAEKNNADIVIGNTVIEEANGARMINLLQNHAFSFDYIETNQEVQKRFYDQRGTIYLWHTIWNKIYRKTLWDNCMPFYETLDKHIIMTEDIAFSSLLFYYANSMVKVNNEAYFYCKNEQASTNSTKLSLEKYIKNVQDMTAVFSFVEDFHNKVQAPEFIKSCFADFKGRYARLWRSIANVEMSEIENRKALPYINRFLPSSTAYITKEDDFFQQFHIPWNGELENIKEKIAYCDYKYISFDLFDTLIKRPFYYPSDLLYLLDRAYENSCDGVTNFFALRMNGERKAREEAIRGNAKCQDITIDDIYSYIQKNYHISPEQSSLLKKAEKELELKYTFARESAKELYDVADISGKEIIIISDMYLDEDTVNAILHKSGYNVHKKLFLSSSYKKTKHMGDLYSVVLEELNAKANQILHIGDNWTSDYVNAMNKGLHAIFFPKAMEVFENKIQGTENNNCSRIAFLGAGDCVDHDAVMRSMGFRSMLALVATKYFDNPFRSFHSCSDFNMDTSLIGYYLLGMHLMGVCQWITTTCQTQNYDSIAFLSRDGYLMKKFYDEYQKSFNSSAETHYVYSSRKALLPGMVSCKTDFFDLPMEPENHTPKTVLSLLSFCVKDISKEEINQIIKCAGFDINAQLKTRDRLEDFLEIFLDKLYDEGKLMQSQNIVKDYYSQYSSQKTVFFDIGYSGRIPAAISKVLEQKINVLYLHDDNHRINIVKRKDKIKCHTYYCDTPIITGVVREHLLSSPECACIGFTKNYSGVEPIFEKSTKNFQDRFIVEQIQEKALEFLKDFIYYFKDYLPYVSYNSQEVSYPFEGFLRYPNDTDISMFNASFFEDLVHGANENINVYEFIKYFVYQANCKQPITIGSTGTGSMGTLMLDNKSRFKRILFYLIFDHTMLKEKIKKKLSRFPFLYGRIAYIYRRIKR